jgi:hypothetical protein
MNAQAEPFHAKAHYAERVCNALECLNMLGR